MQVLQAANTGITSLQKLVDSAKSIANQALQAAVGYSTKSSVTTAAITGATGDNLLGTAYTDARNRLGGQQQPRGAGRDHGGDRAAGTAASSDALATDLAAAIPDGQRQDDHLQQRRAAPPVRDDGTLDIDAAPATVGDMLTAIDSDHRHRRRLDDLGTARPLQHQHRHGSRPGASAAPAPLTALGLTAGTTARTRRHPLDGLTLTIAATGDGTATSITFGNGTGGTVKTSTS